MDLREVGYDDRDWINLAQDRDRWRAYVMRSTDDKKVMKLFTDVTWINGSNIVDINWRRMERIKWTDRIRNEAMLERMGEEDQEEERNQLGYWLRRNCVLKDALEGMVNGRRVWGRRKYQMIDDINIYGSYEEIKRKAENRKGWRKLDLQ
ncbi:hypothetical protein ANN_22468 [Periplaneta americana]|uniref:Uncharacterized protein n=1 Tax=Periplaneta americana TaxID=6978 RepID=A0ABQ8S8A7_PERAM|nr:hypothetical protein ANN_22468 [Periplaneta americana]